MFKTRSIAAIIGGTVLCSLPALASNADWRKPAGAEWPMPDGDWANTRHSMLTGINPGNVKTLGGAWVTKFDGETSRATPVIADGRMFVTAGPHVYALDAPTKCQQGQGYVDIHDATLELDTAHDRLGLTFNGTGQAPGIGAMTVAFTFTGDRR